MAKDHSGKTPVQKSVTRGGKTHEQTFWVNPGKDAPKGLGADRAARVDKMVGAVKARNQRVAQIAKDVGAKSASQLTGLRQHQDHGAHTAEQSRQAHHASDAAERASIKARGSGGGPHTAQQHREAAGAHSEAARLHTVAGNSSNAQWHRGVAAEHARISDMAVHHPPKTSSGSTGAPATHAEAVKAFAEKANTDRNAAYEAKQRLDAKLATHMNVRMGTGHTAHSLAEMASTVANDASRTARDSFEHKVAAKLHEHALEARKPLLGDMMQQRFNPGMHEKMAEHHEKQANHHRMMSSK